MAVELYHPQPGQSRFRAAGKSYLAKKKKQRDNKVSTRGSIQRRGSEMAAKAAVARPLDVVAEAKPDLAAPTTRGSIQRRGSSMAAKAAAARPVTAMSTSGPKVAAASESTMPKSQSSLPRKDATPKINVAELPPPAKMNAAPAKSATKSAAKARSKPVVELPAAQLQAEARARRQTKIGDEGRANRANPVKTSTPTHEHYAGRGYTPRTGRNKTTAELQRDRRK